MNTGQTDPGAEGMDGKTATPSSDYHRSGFDLGLGPARMRVVLVPLLACAKEPKIYGVSAWGVMEKYPN
jgi:hypothetical protein